MLPRAVLSVVLTFLLLAPPLHAQEPAATAVPDDTHLQIPIWGESGEKKLESGDVQGAVEDFKKAFEGSRALRRQYPQELAYSENAYHYLGRLAAAYLKGENIAQAVKLADTGARGYEELVTLAPTEENKEKATNAFGVLAWYQVLNKDGAAAEASARQALEFTPDVTLVNVNLAHALLLNGKRDEAEAIYMAERAKDAGDGRKVREVILEDFIAMEKVGIETPAIGEIRTALGGSKPNGGRRSSKAKSDTPVWPFVAGVALLIGAVFALLMYLDKKRSEKMEAAAKALGFTFRKKPTAEDRTLTAGSQLATIGRSRNIRNIVELPESDGTQLTLFEFQYVTGGGKSSRTHYQTVARFRSSKLNLPSFELRPEGLMAKLVQSLGFKDISLEGRPKFNKMFVLRGQDEAAIRQLFTGPILDYCEGEKWLWMSGAGDRLLVHRENYRAKVEEIEAYAARAREVFALFASGQSASAPTPPPPLPPPPLPAV
jgi:Flp pilus assembly protein TadD